MEIISESPQTSLPLPVLYPCSTWLANSYSSIKTQVTLLPGSLPLLPAITRPLWRVSIFSLFFHSSPHRKPLPHCCSPRAQPETEPMGLVQCLFMEEMSHAASCKQLLLTPIPTSLTALPQNLHIHSICASLRASFPSYLLG